MTTTVLEIVHAEILPYKPCTHTVLSCSFASLARACQYAAVTPYRIALTVVLRTATFCNPFVSVRTRWLSVSCPVNAFLCQAMSVLIRGRSFVHAQNLERTPPAKGIRWLYSYCALSMRFGRHSSVPCPVLVRSHPVFDR